MRTASTFVIWALLGLFVLTLLSSSTTPGNLVVPRPVPQSSPHTPEK